MHEPKIQAETIFQPKSTPECTACQINKAIMAAPRCDPITWMTVLAISSPVVCGVPVAVITPQKPHITSPAQAPQERPQAWRQASPQGWPQASPQEPQALPQEPQALPQEPQASPREPQASPRERLQGPQASPQERLQEPRA